MRRFILLCLIIPFLIINISGCIFILGGAAGALGAYGVSKDTVQGDTDKPYDSLWNAAVDICRIRGTITQEDTRSGYIEGQIESSKVWIKLVRLTQTATRIRISARKFHFPNLNLAEDLYVKILGEAR